MWDTPVCPSLKLGFLVLQMVLHGAIVREKVWSSDFLCFKLCFKVKSDSQILMKHCMRQPCCFNPCLTEIQQSDFSMMMLHPMPHWNPRIRLFSLTNAPWSTIWSTGYPRVKLFLPHKWALPFWEDHSCTFPSPSWPCIWGGKVVCATKKSPYGTPLDTGLG